ncbi:MAG: adenylate/guanylate cyclase domain-containing protein, partial [Pseudobdellovibrio sp.]
LSEVAAHAQAKALVFDLLFTEDSSYGPEDDRMFADLLAKSKVPVFFPAAHSSGAVKDPIPVLKKTATGLGRVDFSNDGDGVFRHVPDLLEASDVNSVTLPQKVFSYFNPGSFLSYDWLYNYKEQAFPVISLYDVLKIYRELQENKNSSADLAAFKNKIWVVGYSAPGLHDLKPTSIDKQAPGFMLQATALANRFENLNLKSESITAYFILLILLMCSVITLINRSFEPVWATFWLVAHSVVAPLLLSIIWWKRLIWLDPVFLFSGVFTAGAIQLVWNSRLVWSERIKLAESLKHSMSPAMLDLIRKGEVQVSRFGEEHEISVLFSDLAGYTTLSEKSTPQEMVRILNAYLDEVVELITSNSGYIDKFIGDAVMVIWGAPVKQADHVKLAFATAVKFHEVCENFNRHMQKENPHFERLITRVGLHTGKAIVGNIGAKQRHNYTAIGDTVNMASRLEGVGKNYHVELTISEEAVTAAGVHDLPELLELDQIILKGKTHPTRIFTVLDTHQMEQAEFYREGLKLYYEADWSQALESFKKALTIPASETMMYRCELALQKGGLENWRNGAWVYDTK